MLFAIDVGNSNIVLGIFDGNILVHQWRIPTVRNVTADEFDAVVNDCFIKSGIDTSGIVGTVIASVVPEVKASLDRFILKRLGHTPHWIDTASFPDMLTHYTAPSEVGADRFVNAVAAFSKYRKSLIVIDFGTATTFDSISEKGEYLGGAIAPGIMISSEALFDRASKLPRIDLSVPPEKAIGIDTKSSMKSGIVFGYAALVDGMVRRTRKEMGTEAGVIATGGLAGIMMNIAETIEKVEPDLTLEGLRIIGERWLDEAG